MSSDTNVSAKHSPTVQSMIICVPAEIPDQAVMSRQVLKHFGVTGTTHRRFWTTPLRPWHHRRLIDLHQGKPATCAGGPTRLLDLDAVRHAAGVSAGLRHQRWSQVVAGTRPATAWHVLLGKHHADPDKYPLAKARADFDNQPRVLAMAMHNAAAYHQPHLDPAELEMFQAGPAAYQHFHALTQICAHALLTEDGKQLTPHSDTFADRIRYLETARRHIDALDPATRLLAVTL